LKKLERANQEISRVLDVGQILHSQQMTRILAECLLSPHGLLLAQRATAKCVLNESDSCEQPPEFKLDKLEGWTPKSRVDSMMLQRFLQKLEPEQNQISRQNLHEKILA